ncbi:PHP domain-containing protein [Microlunatus soli]|uniref:Histidinol-phosphatase n=1 Tax=Microlunatus soli TaxID=630515 RepID=A0A1H1NTZ6_9ACTN|nr:PHP domain-containing protein [Microlunatus soli]SDS02260.1 histidinol-phosphatase (PHP family) [Microlunatus soli]
MLPADSHVHSEWSWDTGGPAANPGRMEATCEQAIRIGLPVVIFTEHFDFDGWMVDPQDIHGTEQVSVSDAGLLMPAPLDVEGYLDCIDRCRHRFPELRILTGVEYGQPHLSDDQATRLIDLTTLDRVNGSLHTLQNGDARSEPYTLFRHWPADRVIEEYLAEVPRMVTGSDSFAVFTHLDYAVRYWPVAEQGPFDPRRFEDGFRQAMRAIAGSGRALEMNTRRLWPWIPQWWAEEGGRAVTFGSDSHVPATLADGLSEAALMLEHFGFRPGRRPEDFWTR